MKAQTSTSLVRASGAAARKTAIDTSATDHARRRSLLDAGNVDRKTLQSAGDSAATRGS
jgi:hypothetical protein